MHAMIITHTTISLRVHQRDDLCNGLFFIVTGVFGMPQAVTPTENTEPRNASGSDMTRRWETDDEHRVAEIRRRIWTSNTRETDAKRRVTFRSEKKETITNWSDDKDS